MKEYFIKFWGTAMSLLSYPYDICLVILAALYVIVSFLLLIFRNLIGGLMIIGHGKISKKLCISKMHLRG